MDPSLIFGALLAIGMIGFLLLIRFKDLPKADPISPFKHLDERKAAIYESLRDLQFEYRVDKLSDGDYQTSKLELQKELARVHAETDRIRGEMGMKVVSPPPAPKPAPVMASFVEAPVEIEAEPVATRFVCPSCHAEFEKALKFCGECGKSMGETA